MYNLLTKEGVEKFQTEKSERIKKQENGAVHFDLQNLELESLADVDVKKINELARLQRGLIFSTLEASQSGHPGGSSSKVEQFLSLVLGGAMSFDALDPKNSGRDRVVWSAGHCSPCLYTGLTLIYEALLGEENKQQAEKIKAVLARDLLRFRRLDGPQGHIENYYPLSDVATGPSGHGLSAAGGMALLHSSCGLPFKTWVFMGDAESEEGMTYEARNMLSAVGAKNLIVSLDYNHFGIDGPIEEVVNTNYLNHWRGLGWNVLEVNGHNVLELIYAYRLAQNGFENNLPTVVIAHTFKGKDYGNLENSNKSHGSPAKHDDYVMIMKNLDFDIKGEQGKVWEDLEVVLSQFSEELKDYVKVRLEVAKNNIKSEKELFTLMKKTIGERKLINPRKIKRPEILPTELDFKAGDKVATRKAAGAWFKWLMNQTAFFYLGSGDLAGSILTNQAEETYGIISKNNPFGRGFRFGIAEQNMAMLSATLTQDKLPGDFQAVSAFGTYAVFTSMMSNCVRLALIGNHLKPDTAGFFVMIAAHDGPETGEDGPTHQGLYWMSMFNAYPGIKVYKPFDAAETVEMLFYALEKGEPIALSLLRPDTFVLDRKWGSDPKDAIKGAYVYKNYSTSEKEKICLVISGTQMLLNTLDILEDLENNYNVKIVNVSSPQLFEEYRKENPDKAQEIFSAFDRTCAIALHNGWKGFLYPFLLGENYTNRTIAIDTYLRSGNGKEVYEFAGLSPQGIKEKILKGLLKNNL